MFKCPMWHIQYCPNCLKIVYHTIIDYWIADICFRISLLCLCMTMCIDKVMNVHTVNLHLLLFILFWKMCSCGYFLGDGPGHFKVYLWPMKRDVQLRISTHRCEPACVCCEKSVCRYWLWMGRRVSGGSLSTGHRQLLRLLSAATILY